MNGPGDDDDDDDDNKAGLGVDGDDDDGIDCIVPPAHNADRPSPKPKPNADSEPGDASSGGVTSPLQPLILRWRHRGHFSLPSSSSFSLPPPLCSRCKREGLLERERSKDF